MSVDFALIHQLTACLSIQNIDVERDPFNQNSDRSDQEKRTTSKGGPVFSKLFQLDWTDPLSFGPKFPEILVEWIAPINESISIMASQAHTGGCLAYIYWGKWNTMVNIWTKFGSTCQSMTILDQDIDQVSQLVFD